MREWRVTSAVDLVARHLSTTSRCTFEDGCSEFKPIGTWIVGHRMTSVGPTSAI